MTAYYNEINPFAAAWLRELMKAGKIASGEVDERDIQDVTPSDLAKFDQCHFFAGIGVWSYSLRCAGWPDNRPVWTGSCPCQPFSSAGKRSGFTDRRHLWPVFFNLISQCRPVTVFGEQVASKDGLAWIDLVFADMEGAGYTVGAVDTCAAGFGAPHIRNRLYWVAHPVGERPGGRCNGDTARMRGTVQTSGRGASGWMAYPDDERCKGRVSGRPDTRWEVFNGCVGCNGSTGRPLPTNGFWRDVDWLFCRDGRWRPVESDLVPLAHGATARVGRLRGYGNAIVAPQAEAFIRAYLEIEAECRKPKRGGKYGQDLCE